MKQGIPKPGHEKLFLIPPWIAKFIKKLKQARFKAGLRQIEVAKKLKRPQSYLKFMKANIIKSKRINDGTNEGGRKR